MGAFRCLVVILVAEIAYVLSPDAVQDAIEIYVVQGQLVTAMFGALLAYSYQHPIGKGALLIGFLWSLTLAVTDWWIPYEPIWGPAVAPTGFLLWLLWLRWADAHVSRGKETGRPAWHGDLSFDGQGGRRRSHRK